MTTTQVNGATPILDGGEPLPAATGHGGTTKNKVVYAVTTMAATILLGSLGFVLSGNVLISLFVVFLPVMAVHELGHAAVGSLCGFGISVVKIGPFLFGTKTDANRTGDFWGYVVFRVDSVKRIGHRMFWSVLGGPAANLLAAAVVFVLKYTNSLPGQQWAADLIQTFGILSLLIGALNLLSIRTSGRQVADGGRLVMLLRPNAKTRRFLAMIATQSLRDRGVRPRDWNDRWLRTAMSLDDKSGDAALARFLACVAASDRKDVTTAALRLENCLRLSGSVPAGFRDLLIYEAAYFQAWYRDDVQKSRQWHAQVAQAKVITPLLAERYKVALNCCLKQFSEALTALEKGLEIIREMPASVRRSSLERGWMEWGDQVRERASMATSDAFPAAES